MENLILSQIPLDVLLTNVRQAVRDELAAGGMQSDIEAPTHTRPVSSKELSRYLKVTEQTIATYRKKGKIPFIQIGSAVRYNLNSVVKALEKQ